MTAANRRRRRRGDVRSSRKAPSSPPAAAARCSWRTASPRRSSSSTPRTSSARAPQREQGLGQRIDARQPIAQGGHRRNRQHDRQCRREQVAPVRTCLPVGVRADRQQRGGGKVRQCRHQQDATCRAQQSVDKACAQSDGCPKQQYPGSAPAAGAPRHLRLSACFFHGGSLLFPTFCARGARNG